jgi:uncharacterized membrane protein
MAFKKVVVLNELEQKVGTMTNRLVQFTGLMLESLVAGVFWGTWFTLTRSLETFTPGEFLHIGKTIITNVAVPMRILMPASLLVILWSVWLYPVKRSTGFSLLLISFALMIVTLLITLLVEVPIDNEIKRWTVDAMPADWEAQRLTWKRFHALRTLTSIAGLAAFAWSALFPPPRTAVVR